MQQGNFAGPVVGAPEDDAHSQEMTFNYEGYVITPWGSPSSQASELLDSVLRNNPVITAYARGGPESRLSMALINFVEHDLSEARMDYILSLLGGNNRHDIVRGEPLLVNCAQATDPPAIYRLGPYGYRRNKAICLIRPVWGHVRFRLYDESHMLDRTGLDHRSLEGSLRAVPLELSQEMVVFMLSDMCLSWPDGSEGLFVLETFSLERQEIAIQRDDIPVKVAPFHATPLIRDLERGLELNLHT